MYLLTCLLEGCKHGAKYAVLGCFAVCLSQATFPNSGRIKIDWKNGSEAWLRRRREGKSKVRRKAGVQAKGRDSAAAEVSARRRSGRWIRRGMTWGIPVQRQSNKQNSCCNPLGFFFVHELQNWSVRGRCRNSVRVNSDLCDVWVRQVDKGSLHQTRAEKKGYCDWESKDLVGCPTELKTFLRRLLKIHFGAPWWL